jgi:hypothetical protein
MALQSFFPFTPNFMSWEDWNGNLVMFYGEEPIPALPEEDWKQVANNVAQLATFLNYPVPDPQLYENWQDWALEFTEIINGPTQ